MAFAINGKKDCSTCGVVLDVSHFGKNRRQPDGYQNTCKPCSRAYTRRWYLGRREDPAFVESERSKVRDQGFRDKLAKHGVTREEYEAVAAAGCGVCGAARSANGKRLAIDHDHATGLFRGVLCSDCNLSIGKLGDTAPLVARAVAYLERTTPELIWDEMI